MESDTWKPNKEVFNISRCIIRNTELSKTSKLLLLNLYSYAGTQTKCWPSRGQLIEDLGISFRMLDYSISELKEKNYIKTKWNGKFNEYHFIKNEYIKTSKYCTSIEPDNESETATDCKPNCNMLQPSTATDCKQCNRKESSENQHENSKRINSFTRTADKELQPKSVPKNVPKQVMTIIDYYYATDIKNRPAPTTKTYKMVIDFVKYAMIGKLFNGDASYKAYQGKKFTIKEIKDAIDCHVLSLSTEYYPLKKKHLKIHLHDFLYNSFLKKNQSYLIKWQIESPIKIPKYIQKVGTRGQPIIISGIMKHRHWNELLPEDMEKLVSASLSIFDFFKDNQTQFSSPSMGVHEASVVDVVNGAITEKLEQLPNLKPGFYASDFFIKDYLPEYCKRKGIIRK